MFYEPLFELYQSIKNSKIRAENKREKIALKHDHTIAQYILSPEDQEKVDEYKEQVAQEQQLQQELQQELEQVEPIEIVEPIFVDSEVE